MKFLSLALALATVVSGDSPSGRILGGEDVDISSVPYTLSVEYDQRHICGGVILSANRALTTAACVHGLDVFYLAVRGGTNTREKGGQRVFVENVIEHPQFNVNNNDNDLAVLVLQGSFQLNSNVQPATLPQRDDIFADNVGRISGFGIVTEGGPLAGTLHATDVEINTFDNCRRILGYRFNEHMVCAGGEFGKDACHGDIGVPLVYEGKLVGVAAWGVTCGQRGIPRAYSSVANLIDFITSSL